MKLGTRRRLNAKAFGIGKSPVSRIKTIPVKALAHFNSISNLLVLAGGVVVYLIHCELFSLSHRHFLT